MSSHQDPEVIRETARRILERPEFAEHRGLIERALDWLAEKISEFLGGIGGGISGGTGILGSLIQIAVVIGAVVAIVLLIRVVWRMLGSRSVPASGDGLVVVLGRSVDPSELAAEAVRAEAAGEWKQAILAHYRHMAAMLIIDGTLSDVVGRTTGEYRVEFGEALPSSAGDFDQATSIFEDAYYGDVPVGSADVEQIRNLALRLSSVRHDPELEMSAP